MQKWSPALIMHPNVKSDPKIDKSDPKIDKSDPHLENIYGTPNSW